MSISNARIFWKGESAKLTFNAGLPPDRTRTVVWVCNSSSNNALDVAYQFDADPSVPTLGDALDGDLSSRLRDISAARADGTTDAWYVSLSYGPDGDEKEEREKEDGTKTKDPLSWADEINISFSRMNVPVYRAFYRGGYRGWMAGQIQPGQVTCPMNSAFMPFNPTLEKDVPIKHVRISKWRGSCNGEELNNYQNRVNNDIVTINKPNYKYTDRWQQYTARVMNIGGSFQLRNEIRCWKIDYEIAIKHDGWREEVVDRGVVVRAVPNVDPDGEGGTIPPPPQSDDNGQPIPPPKGRTFHRNQMDQQFVPVTEPMLLDGDGQELEPGKDPVYIIYSIYPEGPYGPMKL